jgi:hypothetical protein
MDPLEDALNKLAANTSEPTQVKWRELVHAIPQATDRHYEAAEAILRNDVLIDDQQEAATLLVDLGYAAKRPDGTYTALFPFR